MTDRNLLFGILALQMDFITRDQLVAGMHGWVLNKLKPMTAIELYHRQRRELARRAALDLDPPFRQLLRRFHDVCNAIEYAHSRGVLHRDLKPGNIMLGKYGETLVVDWGLAKALGKTGESDAPASIDDEMPLLPASGSGSAETLPGAALGTPPYMSPEQAVGRLDLLGPPSDVYTASVRPSTAS